MAASPRASARRCSKAASTTRERPAPHRLLHGLLHAAGRRSADLRASPTNTTLCTHNPLGVKGCGEAGAIGAPAARDERGRRCAGAARRRGTSTCRRRPSGCGARSSQHSAASAQRELGRANACTISTITARRALADAAKPPRRRRGRQAGRRRHDPDPDPEAASGASPPTSSISARIAELKGIKRRGRRRRRSAR